MPNTTTRKLTALSVVALLVATTGCANLSKSLKHLKDDPAIVVHNFSTIYGTSKLVRVGGQTNNTVTIGTDGTVTISPGSREAR